MITQFMKLMKIMWMQTRLNFQNVYHSLGKNDSFYDIDKDHIENLKNSKFDLSKNYFFKAKTRNSISILNQYIANSLYIWSELNKLQ